MELRAYLDVFGRRWPVVVALPLLVVLLAAYLDLTRTPNYTASARLSVFRISEQSVHSDYDFDNYYDFLATEFIIDDLVEIVRGSVFANAVAERLDAQGVPVDAGTVSGALSTSREHRVLTIGATTTDGGLSVVIANVAAAELRENFTGYLGPLDEALPMTIRPVDVPVAAGADTNRFRLSFVLAVIAATGFGVLAGLLWEYLDDSVHTGADAAQATGLALLGVVPGDRR